ncbi:MAG: Nif11 domain/cupin domain-containing protein [Cyanobium sp.]
MAEAQLQAFLEKVRQLNAFVARSEADPQLRAALRDCSHHQEVVTLARQQGFEIGRRWGETALMPGGDANLLGSPCPEQGDERIELLIETPNLRLEHIHSCRASSPGGFWYDQPLQEWVTILQGSAQIRFDDEAGPRELNRGDSLLISAHRRHRVERTDPHPGTIWLALFWSPG